MRPMRRTARLERRVTFHAVDGGPIVEAGPGLCAVREDGASVTVTWRIDDRETSVRIANEALARHLASRDLVYVSW